MRDCLAWTLVLLLWPATAALAGPPSAPAHAVATRALDRAGIEKAVAGVVVGALAAQFDGRDVEARFDAFDDQPGDDGRRSISGEGQMRFAGDLAWIGFKFRTSYDVLLGQAGVPELAIGAGGDARPVPNDTAIVRQLDDRLVDALRLDLGLSSIRLQLDRIESVETGQNYLLIDAWGLADFGRDGSSNIRIAAFYDRRSGQWLQLHYDVDAPPAPAMPPVAGR
ncbi:hypothetical protein AB4Y64_00610 [Lysobacter sp. TAF61]|uniref:hypothetical protein n=1 Tax=Lysobacter sp. TAF61 TaxID=3233072 RepID=UPI003F9446B0